MGEGCLGDEAVKAVEAAGPYAELGDFAGLPQAGGVGDDLVAERLGRADVEEGRGNPDRSSARAGAAYGETSGPPRRSPSNAVHPVSLAVRSHTPRPAIAWRAPRWT